MTIYLMELQWYLKEIFIRLYLWYPKKYINKQQQHLLHLFAKETYGDISSSCISDRICAWITLKLIINRLSSCQRLVLEQLSIIVKNMWSKNRVTQSGAELLWNGRELTTKVENNLGLSSCAVSQSAVMCVVVYFRRTELLPGVQERSGIQIDRSENRTCKRC